MTISTETIIEIIGRKDVAFPARGRKRFAGRINVSLSAELLPTNATHATRGAQVQVANISTCGICFYNRSKFFDGQKFVLRFRLASGRRLSIQCVTIRTQPEDRQFKTGAMFIAAAEDRRAA